MDIKKKGKSMTLCYLAIAGDAILIGITAWMCAWAHRNTEALSHSAVILLTAIAVIAIAIGAFLLIQRDYLKEVLNSTYQDVTGIHNKKSLEKKIQQLKERNDILNVGMMIFDLNDLKRVNDHYGHEKGDELIQSFAACLTRITTTKSFLARFGGDEFVIIQEDTTVAELQQMENNLKQIVNVFNLKTDLPISYAVGYDVSYKNHYYLIDDLMDDVDKKMYQDKTFKKALMNTMCVSCYKPQSTVPTLSVDIILSEIYQILNDHSKREYVITLSDIDNFHLINENYGFEMGSDILNILNQELPKFEHCVFASHLHTDVFISVLENKFKSQEEMLVAIEKKNIEIAQKIKEKYLISYLEIKSGVYFVDGMDVQPEMMISCANIARNRARNKKEHVCAYTDAIEKKEKLRAQVLHNFRIALEKDAFKVYFQPKVNSKTMSVSSAEALVRWQKEDGSLWAPDTFIPPLESSGLITELDFYVYEKTFQWMQVYQHKHHKMVPIALNVSRAHLKDMDYFVEIVFGLIEKYHIDTQYVIFEITESMFIEHPDKINQLIKKFHEKHIRISMDDFGSGYSSLNTLKDILFDEVKIDRQFLQDELSVNGKIVLQELFHMLRRMDKSIVCEGVETENISDFLRNEGCDEMQGFLFYKPMPEEAFEKVLGEI